MATMSMQLFTGDILLDREVIARLWRALRVPPVPAKLRYANCQPYRTPVDDDVTAPFALFERERSLMFGTRTRPRRFQGSIERHGWGPDGIGGLGDVWFHLELDAWDPRWLDWLLAIVADLPVLYGNAWTQAEHDAKHKAVTEYMLGRRTGWVGASNGELKRGLPGIYWLNLFGAALTSGLDLGRAREVNGAIVHDLPGGQTAVLAGPDPLGDARAMAELERAITIAIGDDYFFDRTRPDRALRPVKEFSDEITRLWLLDQR